MNQGLDYGHARRWQPFPGSLCLIAGLDAGSAPASRALDVSGARQRQSRAARALGCQAVQSLGGPASPVGKTSEGAPSWPPGWVGSLAHDLRTAVALVGPVSLFAALGVDVEPDEPLPEDAVSVALTADEQILLSRLPGGLARWSRIAFCAKESLHKCIHPLHGLWLEFDEVEARISPEALRFTLSPRSQRAEKGLRGIGHGVIRREQGQVVTALGIFPPGGDGT